MNIHRKKQPPLSPALASTKQKSTGSSIGKLFNPCKKSRQLTVGNKQETRLTDQRKVRSAIEDVLYKDLPESYDRVEFKKTCDQIYELVYEYASKGLKWAA